jgi:hypothetical protein
MVWRIDENVVRGEIDNRIRGRVDGKIWLADRNDPLVLQLTGNCHKDLAGCRITFSNPAAKLDAQLTLSSGQSGAVGDITAAPPTKCEKHSDGCQSHESGRQPA